MRMPKPRQNHSMVKWVKRTWTLYNNRNRVVEDFSNPPDMPPGVKIYDALDFVTPTKEKIIFPAPFQKEACYYNDKRNPDWKEGIFHYTQDTRIIEGYKQSLVLFKTVLYKGMPESILPLVGQIKLENADDLLKAKIVSEYFWDSSQELLPKHVDPESPRHIFPRNYGVTLKRKVRGLQDHLWNLCSSAVGPASAQRHKMATPYAKVFFEREGQRVLSEVVCDHAILGSNPLPAIDKNPTTTEGQALEEIYPLSPLVDLGPINIYKEGHLFCVGAKSPKRFCHMLLLGDTYEKKWLEKQILARGISACFTFAASQALNMFGPKVKLLPKPVSVNCMLFGEKNVAFLSYQLNTLDLDANTGVKNQVWLDGPHQLFQSYNDVEGLVEYDSSIFPKALAYTLCGLNI